MSGAKSILLCFYISACFYALALARPQQQGFNQFFPQQQQQNVNPFFPQQPQQPQFPSRPGNLIEFPIFITTTPTAISPSSTMLTGTTVTTPAPAPSSTAVPSPAYLTCLRNCPSTSEYNPVCGSDAQNYHNQARLDCAAFCGQNVVFVRMGTCLPL